MQVDYRALSMSLVFEILALVLMTTRICVLAKPAALAVLVLAGVRFAIGICVLRQDW